MAAVPGELESSLEAAASEKVTLAGDGAVVVQEFKRDVSTANAEDAIVSSEDATPIVEAAALDRSDGPTSPGAEAPPVAPAALPMGPEVRSASGEIIVRPSKTKIKHSPAAEVRLAHLREESAARAFVRPSQSLTPPGSARALDEPPPLLDSAPPEPTARATTQLVRATAVEAAVASSAEEEAAAPTSHRRGALIAGAVSMVVLGAGILWLAARHPEPAADTPAQAAARPPAPAAPTPAPAPVAKPAPAKAVPAPLDEAEERNADPKLARTRALEAAPLLVACRTAYQDARMKDAEAACLAARDANPKSAEANGFLAHALLNRGRRREALAAAELAVKLNQKWADPYAVIGTIHQDAGEIADARRAYQRYLELEPHGSYANELRTIVDRLGKL
jgi:hypothetical protein